MNRPAGQVLVAVVRCSGCGREYFSALVPRIDRPLPPCPDCGDEQRVVDLIVGE